MTPPLIKTDTRGFTLVEMLISMLVASVLMLTIGVLSTIANASFNTLVKTQKTHDDLSYGVKFVQNRVRTSKSVRLINPGDPWIGEQLQINNGASFGRCMEGGRTNLVHRPTAAATCTESDILISTGGGDSLNFSVSWPCACNDTAAHECVGPCLDDCRSDLVGTNCACRDKTTEIAVPNSGQCLNPPASWPCECNDTTAHECVDGCLTACNYNLIQTECACIHKTTENPVPNSGRCRNQPLPPSMNATISGVKNKIPFTVETTIFRRNS